MAFITVGIICSYFSWDIFTEGINAPLVRILAELTLILVLFNDALEWYLLPLALLVQNYLFQQLDLLAGSVPGVSHLSSIC
jgi:hypothetical protein